MKQSLSQILILAAGGLLIAALLIGGPLGATPGYAAPSNLTPTEPPTLTPSNTPVVPPTNTPTSTPTAVIPPTDTPAVPPTDTPAIPPTNTPAIPPTRTPAPPPTDTPVVPPTDTPVGLPTNTPQLQQADPSITKRANVSEAQVGDEVVFTLTVTNNGAVPATGVVVNDPVPSFLTVLDATASRGALTRSGNTVTVDLGDVAPGEVITVVIRTRVVAAAVAPDNVNTAVLTTTSSGDIPSNNQDGVPIGVITPGADGPSPTPTAAALPGAPGGSAPPPASGSPASGSPANPPPAMPRSGSADHAGLRLALFGLALGCFAAGLLLARRTRRAA